MILLISNKCVYLFFSLYSSSFSSVRPPFLPALTHVLILTGDVTSYPRSPGVQTGCSSSTAVWP